MAEQWLSKGKIEKKINKLRKEKIFIYVAKKQKYQGK